VSITYLSINYINKNTEHVYETFPVSPYSTWRGVFNIPLQVADDILKHFRVNGLTRLRFKT